MNDKDANRLLHIQEACGSLSDEFNEANPIVDWQAWKDMRNILTDQSFGAGNRMKFP